MPNVFVLIRELRRRRVFRVAGLYLVGAFTVMEVADVVADPAGLPGWVLTALLYLLVLGFPLAVFLGWRYEFGEEGIVRTQPASADEIAAADTSLRKSDYAIFAAMVLIVGVIAYEVIPTLRNQSQQAPPGVTLPIPVKENSVAVLPFADLSPNSDHAYLADGLSDTVLHLLSQVHGLTVTARTSSFAFRDKAMDIGQIATALAVAHVLEGSVQLAGEQLRVIARLIDARDGSEVWSGNFDRELSGIFAVQDEIAREVVAALKVTVLDESETPVDERYQPKLAAYEQFVLGRSELYRYTSRSHQAAEEHFKKAIELDPNYAPAYVGLAETYLRQTVTLGRNPVEAQSLRLELVNKALDLDPLLAEAHNELAAIQAQDKDFEASLKSVQRAIELNPNLAEARAGYANLLVIQGRKEEALAQLRIAAEIDPQSDEIRADLARVLWSLARAEEAVAIIRENIVRNPDLPTNYALLARWLKQLGRAGASMYYVNVLHRMDPDNVRAWRALCEEYWQLWDEEASAKCFEEFIAAHPEDLDAKYWLAGLRGDLDEAIRLQEARVAAMPNFWYPRAQLADMLARAGEWDRVLEVLEPAFPQLFAEPPQVNDFSMWPARLVAMAWLEKGEQARADVLLDVMLETVMRSRKLQGAGWLSGVEDAQIYALQGETDKALDALERAIDSGWMFYALAAFEEASFSSLADHPRFQALKAHLAERMARERQWYEAHKDEPLESVTF